MPEEGVSLAPPSHLLSNGELLRLASLFVRSGVNKIRLTGGEPTLRKDLVELCREMKQLPGLQILAITSNGVLLPPLLPALRDAGVTHINISLDTLDRDKFARIARRTPNHWDRVWDAIQRALALGFVSVKINAVVMRGVNDDEIVKFVELTRLNNVQVRFIELMPFSGNEWSAEKVVGYEEMLRIVRHALPDFEPIGTRALTPSSSTPSDIGHDTAKLWHVPGYAGTVGFISTITNAFCGTCNRLRLTADGSVKVCLHGDEETSLRDVMRNGASDEDVHAAIAEAVQRKHKALGGKLDIQHLAAATTQSHARPMVKIGG